MKKQFFYFADKEDLKLLASKIDQEKKLIFTQTGLFDSKDEIVNYTSLSEVDSLGSLWSGDMNHNQSFLVTEQATYAQVRVVPQRNGGIKYAIDQKENLGSCIILLSGEFNESIVMGKVASIHSNDKSREIEAVLCYAIKSLSQKVEGIYVMDGSMQKGRSGWNLTDFVGSNNNLDV